MRNALIITAAAALVLAGCSTARESVKDRSREKTSFQSNAPWKPVTDNRADIAMVYGTTDAPGMTFEQRVESWRSHGYNTHFMTGIAWGEYQDYFTGKWDGKPHLDEGQVTAAGDTLWHGYMVPYIVPTDNFIKYMKERQIKRVIDAGIDAIYLEEPEGAGVLGTCRLQRRLQARVEDFLRLRLETSARVGREHIPVQQTETRL